jgi:transforming growth factor-beta-induced protein
MYKHTFIMSAFALAITVGFNTPHAYAQELDVVETAIATPALSTLVDLVVSADLAETLATTEDITVFAPTNDAFAKLPKVVTRAIEANPTILTNILTYHVAGERLRALDVVGMKSIATLQGDSIRVRVAGENVFLNMSRVTDVDIETTNATVHLIDRVLLYPGVIRDVIQAISGW